MRKGRAADISSMVKGALFAAVICVISPWAVPVGEVSLTLTTLMIYIAGAELRPSNAFFVVLVYILTGAVGLPVFSGFTGGIHRLVDVTGGYIIGYLPCVITISLILHRKRDKFMWYPIAMACGTVILYALGTGWFMFITAQGLYGALLICVVPFLIGDIIKIIAASMISYVTYKRLGNRCHTE